MPQAMSLEIACLSALSFSVHFPDFYSADEKANTVTMEHCGALAMSEGLIDNLELQVLEIVGDMEKAGVIHLDNHESGKHFFLKSGVLKVIDFDVAYIDGFPITREIKKAVSIFYDEGGYEGYAEKSIDILRGRLAV
jgi:tRNA A-37 threonylcarbamoyl transferase component Bud32